MSYSRRSFFRTAGAAGMAGALPGLFLPDGCLPSPLTAAEAQVTPDLVQLRPEIEPLVRLIEETPRERCLEMAAEQLRRGVPYRQFLAALFLAGIRNVNPQPPGFKFHCVFAIHAAHQMSLDAPASDRLYPLFWALHEFKDSQQKDVGEGDFHLSPVRGELPSAGDAWAEFAAGMDAWDEERADRAIVALVRSRGAHEIVSRLWGYGARDYRNIGHKAIFVANAWRTLQTIGWRHGEPVLRSLVLGLLDFGKDERVNDYAFEDQAWLPNVDRARQAAPSLPGDWAARPADDGLTLTVLAAIRAGDLAGACQHACSVLADGQGGAASVWDAVHLAAGELMMRQGGIFGIHTVTSANALDYAYRMAADSETRLLMTLQGVGWMTQFRNFMATRPQGLSGVDIAALEPPELAADAGQTAEQILAQIGSDTPAAARLALAYGQRWPEADDLPRAARRMVVLKARDAHDFKYPVAILEDLELVSPRWRPQMLATAVYHLPGSSAPVSPVVEEARALAQPG